jgi:hypothetical protein
VAAVAARQPSHTQKQARQGPPANLKPRVEPEGEGKPEGQGCQDSGRQAVIAGPEHPFPIRAGMGPQQAPAQARGPHQQGGEEPKAPLLVDRVAAHGKQGAVGLDHSPFRLEEGPAQEARQAQGDHAEENDAEEAIPWRGEEFVAQSAQQGFHLSAPGSAQAD